MTQPLPMAGTPANVNLVGLTKGDYRGNPTTLCQGCGHNSISNQIISAMYEMSILPENVIKFSGIGCSSKSPTYFMNFGDHTLKGLAVSGDGDTASIGMGQFKHIVRRNVNMVYIVENNGVYGLTKGQFSATAEKGLALKKQGANQYMPVDICMEALASSATFVARSFAGNPKQVKELLKAAMAHKGIAVLDIISPCVTFNNNENAYHSYAWGKDHEAPLHDITYIAPRNEIILEEEMKEGEIREVSMHDGSVIILKNLEKDYNPTDRFQAMNVLAEAHQNNWLATGLIYVEPGKPSLTEIYNLVDSPLNRLEEADLRPAPDMIDKINALMF
jgi:2-oxoglutarate ferredoxin oxidoreductase subunit beta